MINEVIYLGQLSADPASPTNGMIWYNATLQKLRKREGGVTSNLDTTGGGGLTQISGLVNFDFGNENDSVVMTIANASITNAAIKTATFLPQETTATSLDDFTLNNVMFNIENIVDNTSFDIRGNAHAHASGIYQIKYIINI